jgi:hypothetical protein
MAHPNEMHEEPTQPTDQRPYPRQPVKKWQAHNGFTYDSPTEAIEADILSKVREVDGRLSEVLSCRRKFFDGPFDALTNRNLRLAKVKAQDAVARLKSLCDEYEFQAAEDAKAGK